MRVCLGTVRHSVPISYVIHLIKSLCVQIIGDIL